MCRKYFKLLVYLLSKLLNTNVHHIRLCKKKIKAEPTLVLKFRGDVTRNQKLGCQWPNKKTCVCVHQKLFLKKIKNDLYINLYHPISQSSSSYRRGAGRLCPCYHYILVQRGNSQVCSNVLLYTKPDQTALAICYKISMLEGLPSSYWISVDIISTLTI